MDGSGHHEVRIDQVGNGPGQGPFVRARGDHARSQAEHPRGDVLELVDRDRVGPHVDGTRTAQRVLDSGDVEPRGKRDRRLVDDLGGGHDVKVEAQDVDAEARKCGSGGRKATGFVGDGESEPPRPRAVGRDLHRDLWEDRAP